MIASKAMSLARRKAVLTRWHGVDDPRTIEVARQLAEANWRAAQDEADRLRAVADAMAVAP